VASPPRTCVSWVLLLETCQPPVVSPNTSPGKVSKYSLCYGRTVATCEHDGSTWDRCPVTITLFLWDWCSDAVGLTTLTQVVYPMDQKLFIMNE
jgi:hypothetical protein